MANKILVPIDGSDHGWKALDLAVELARNRDAEIVVFHAMPYEPLPDGLKEFAKVEGINVQEEDALFHAARQIGDALTRDGERRVRDAGYEVVSSRSAEDKPSRAILDAAESLDASMIVMGSRGISDAAGLLLGSVSHKVSHLAPCTCILVK
ncbi:MAG: universal stress protein [Pseudomonadota bacterium]